MRRLLTIAGAIALVAAIAACQPKDGTGAASADIDDTPSAGSPAAAEPSVPPTTEAPTASPSPKQPPPKPSPSPTSKCKEGKYQLEVEKLLDTMGAWGNLKADGKQSDADCEVIKKFQNRFGLRPVDGIPGPATLNVAKRIKASDPSRCKARQELTACVDLTHQTTWLMKGGKVIHGPTVTRTGYNHPDGKGSPTPAGTWEIIERQRSNWTEDFDTYLHYWQRIVGNNGFHETTTYIHNMALGSHGCVNLLRADAIAYWEKLERGTPVHIFGRRPGT